MALEQWLAYLQKIEAEREALQNQPPAPMFPPEVAAERRATNQREQMLGTLGQLTEDAPIQNVGGMFLKNAVEKARERVSDKGITDPIAGTTTYFPEYLQEQKRTRLDGKADRAMQGYLKAVDTRENLQARLDGQLENRRLAAALKGGLVDALGTGQHTPIGTSDTGGDVFRTKGGQIYVYNDRGQPTQYQGKVYNKGALPSQTVREIGEKRAYLGEHDNFYNSFKPEFAGTAPILAKVEAATGRYTGGPAQPMSEWWQAYRNWTINLRRDLFGTALTAPEKALFDEANIEPGMHAETIKRRMEQQQLAITRALNKVTEQYRGHYGMDPTPERPTPAPGAAPASPMSVWNSEGPIGQALKGVTGSTQRQQPAPGPVNTPNMPSSQVPGGPSVSPVGPSNAAPVQPVQPNASGWTPEKQRRLDELRRLQSPQ